MARREAGNLHGERFCADRSSRKVHDLDHETTDCRIDDIIAAGNDVPFKTMSAAREAGYSPCLSCFGYID